MSHALIWMISDAHILVFIVFQNLFDEFDQDGNLVLDKKEMRKAFNSLGTFLASMYFLFQYRNMW